MNARTIKRPSGPERRLDPSHDLPSVLRFGVEKHDVGSGRMAPRNRDVPHSDRAEHEMREQEVLRANKELAAYFKGRRTEREARAALKIIKAFIRHRERIDPANRHPLPGSESATVTTKVRKPKKTASPERVRRRSPGRQTRRDVSKDADAPDVASTLPDE